MDPMEDSHEIWGNPREGINNNNCYINSCYSPRPKNYKSFWNTGLMDFMTLAMEIHPNIKAINLDLRLLDAWKK